MEKLISCFVDRINMLNDEYEIRCIEIKELIEESYVFRYKNINPLITKHKNLNSSKHLQTLMLNEFKKIKQLKKASTCGMEEYLSPYGSFYYGDDTFYYDDRLRCYNDEQKFQIICNHIFHYMLACDIYKYNELTIKSNILLAFSHLGITEQKVKYSISGRNSLYENKKYKDIIDNVIIFPPCNNYINYFIQKSISHDYFIKYDYIGEKSNYKMIMGG